MDTEKLASQLLRALRGKRTQAAFSRRLGYRTNVAHTWETGRGYPTASKLFLFVTQLGGDPVKALQGFYRSAPERLETLDLTTSDGVRELLTNFRGQATQARLAEQLGRDRFAVGRWFSGQTEPRLPEFLHLVDACTLRLPDFIASFVDPGTLPALAPLWSTLQAARRAAYQLPWSHAVLRMLELESYQALPKHVEGWLASRLRITQVEERRCLELLSETGQVHWDGSHYHPQEVLTVDTRRDGDAARELAAFWARQGAERIEQRGEGHFAYNLIGVSNADFDRIRELQRSYFAQLRAIVAQSQPVQQVAAVNMQLFPLSRES